MRFLPCGQIRLVAKEVAVHFWTTTTIDKGAIGCIVTSFPTARLSYAESPCEDGAVVKKILVLETHDAEVYRAGSSRVVILSLKGVNRVEFFTRQIISETGVDFTLALEQTHPWTGNPHFTDFEDIFALLRSFTNCETANVFHRFGEMAEAGVEDDRQGDRNASGPTSSRETEGLPSEERDASDPRQLRPLRSMKFSPQMAFGGDVSVNMEVILNWLGITERMLPNVLNSHLCDMLERMLYNLAKINPNHTSTA
ncbi:unnamed protein product [Phytomonas sp. Hart1]|nr:unnamed protein product [Phytomonas sp. Hart1]|eukprot:CCW71728.1 unnamed protein product [Phytomonas sp. isolate Hart1]